MAYYDITAFDGTTIVTSERQMTAMSESAMVIARVYPMENGAKFDADGATDADVMPGTITVSYRVRPATKGATSLNTLVAGLTALRGKHGTLTGVERAETPVTRTCTARCIEVTEAEIMVGASPPMTANHYQTTVVTMVWEKLTEWA